MSKTQTQSQQYDAIVVGAGIAGLYQLYRLREMGLKVHAIEAGGGVGGTWYWNRYPGARVDSQAHIYQYWFSDELLDEWEWSQRFPAQPETERYLNYVADKFDLRKNFSFDTSVKAAKYDESAKRWLITTDSGKTYDTQHFVCCTGMLSAPVVTIPGKENFQGMICHTARWPKEPVDFAGKRVGVVGNAATGIQVIQSIAPECAQLKVFQRTPQYTVKINNPELTDADNAAARKLYPKLKEQVFDTFAGFNYDFNRGSFHDYTPEQRHEILEELWADGSLNFWVGPWFEVFTEEQANEEISAFVREKLRARVDDPELAEKLTPRSYGFGTRRAPLDTNYFETYNRDNVELVDVKDNPIEQITAKGLKLANGEEYELDILVLATGFDAGSGALTRIDIRGRDNLSLKEKWDEEIRTTLGLQVHGFPNLFTTGAPLAPSAAFCNMTTCLQQQADWIADTIGYLREHGLHTMEPTAEKEDEWVAHHDEVANMTLVTKTDSWYMNTNIEGKTRRLISYIGGAQNYKMACDEIKEKGYPGFETA